jgi:alpha-L-rhamnosidase
MIRTIVFFLLAATPVLQAATSVTGLPINEKLLLERWSAGWVNHRDGPYRDFGVFHFRKTFELTAAPEQFIVHVSADNRYRLFINGEFISAGPARSDLDHWRYETVDLAPHLKAGKNVLAAIVWNFGIWSPMAQHSERTALLMQGNTEAEEIVNTGDGWVSLHSDAYQVIPMTRDKVPYFYVVGPGEELDAASYPWGWRGVDYDDSTWQPVMRAGGAQPMELFQWNTSRWLLTPRPIPPMEETPERLQKVVRGKNLTTPAGFVNGSSPIIVPANTKAELLLDRGHLTTAYPELTVAGGEGASVRINYAESLRDADGNKGNRNEIEGKRISRNNYDFFHADGQRRTYRPLWWRTYRYVRLDIETKGEPLTLHDFLGDFTAYPVERHATIDCPDDEFLKMLEIGWRTQRVCTNETYFDTPQYEQLAYSGDGRLQAMITFTNMWDDRINRNHIEHFWYSAVPEGLVQDRYPSREPQFIPSYALDWIRTLHDFFYYRDDPDFLRRFIPQSRDIIDWYLRRLDDRHVIRTLSWTDEQYDGPLRFHENVPQARNQLELILAMEAAVELEEHLGDPARAGRYRALLPTLRRAAFDAFWVAEKGLLARNVERADFSQHSNVLGILTDVIPQDKQRAALEYTIENWDELPRVQQAKSGFFFFYFRNLAMAKVGIGDQLFDNLNHYREQIALGFTTWGESISVETRSDSHSWSAGLNANAMTVVCGITPTASSFREVRIAPHLNGMEWLNCVAPHPRGEVRIELKQGEDGLHALVDLPEATTGWFDWKGRRIALQPGAQTLSLPR